MIKCVFDRLCEARRVTAWVSEPIYETNHVGSRKAGNNVVHGPPYTQFSTNPTLLYYCIELYSSHTNGTGTTASPKP